MPQSPLTLFNDMARRGARGTGPQALTLEVTEGRVPTELRGVLFRNGPGRLSAYGVDYQHLFDGDGFVQKLAFGPDGVQYRSRYVETPEFQQEQAAGRMLYRGFGTNLPGGLRRNLFRFHFKNTANTNLLWMGDSLLALWEGGGPYELDPETLACLGPWNGGGELSARSSVERMMGNGRPFAAHPKVLPDGKGQSFGLSPGLIQRLIRYRLDTRQGRVQTISEERLPRLTFIHDFALTADGTAVFFDPGVAFHLAGPLLGTIPPAASVRGDDSRETLVRIFPPDQPQASVTAPSGYVFHIPNGYREREGIVVDTCWLEHFPDTDDFAALLQDKRPIHDFLPKLTRHRVDPARGSHSAEVISEYPIELTSINERLRGQKHRYVWGVSEEPGRDMPTVMHALVKVDTALGMSRFRDFHPLIVGEPLLVSRGTAEDDAWLLVLAYDPTDNSGALLILEADSLASVARLRLPEPVHLGFHGIWATA